MRQEEDQEGEWGDRKGKQGREAGKETQRRGGCIYRFVI